MPFNWAPIRGRGLPKRVRKGTDIYRKGDGAAGLYFLEKGSAHVIASSARGRDLVVRRLSVGDMFGEIAVFDRGPRTATVRAIRD